jgi:hypothetical protein
MRAVESLVEACHRAFDEDGKRPHGPHNVPEEPLLLGEWLLTGQGHLHQLQEAGARHLRHRVAGNRNRPVSRSGIGLRQGQAQDR